MRRLQLVCALLCSAGVAHASDKPIYAPAPAWVVPAPVVDTAALTDASPASLILDTQAQMKDGQTWTYFDGATRAISAQALGQLGTVTIPWLPDRGNLIIHRAEILRGKERIDLLKAGERFVVLRREEMMEQRILTGLLTATLSVEGLRIGDVLRLSFSITQSDPAFGGRTQALAQTPAAPFRAQFARARFLWPVADKVHWKGYADGLVPTEKTIGGWRELTFALPLAKQPELPGDLPQRYTRPPIVEATTFADWADVSRAMTPLYATKGLIAPGSALAGEVAAIAAADTDPLKRTERALELVQDKVRYLAMGMNGGGLTPQSPARTWELRYGDCKAKTLLLLAILHELGIDAEAATASIQTGGFVGERLPSAGAFDHVIVRATVGGETLYLDGTGLGARLEDIRDVPGFRYVLPLRAAGAGIEALPVRADARPRRTVEMVWDESAGVEFPANFDATIGLRGPFAQALGAMVAQADAEQKRELVRSIVTQEVGEAQLSRSAVTYDPTDGTARITASGIVTTPWRRDANRYRQSLDRAIGNLDFSPDRSRAAWRDIPVATEGPDSVLYKTTITLPKGVTGFTLEGDQALTGTIAGRAIKRSVVMADGRVTIADRIDATGADIAPAALPEERARFARAQGNLLRVVAPAVLPRRWEAAAAGRKDGRFKPIEAVFTAAIAADPKEVSGYTSRASFRAGIYDRAGAIADLDAAIAIEDTVELRVRRGSLQAALGNHAKAIADYQAALALEPANDGVLNAVTGEMAHGGDAKGALALLDERIARGDRDRYGAVQVKAEILVETGDAQAGVALLDAAIVEKPGMPALLNSRCWAKGTGDVSLDTALKDCTRAIELGDIAAGALDSRALVYFRMGRLDDALADLDAALETAPGQSASLFMRGVVRRRMGKATEAEADLMAARAIDPQIDVQYKRYGIVA